MVSLIKQGLRALARAPWYGASVVGVIAFAITLTVTSFAIVDGTLFKPLPYREAGRLYAVDGWWSDIPPRSATFTPASMMELDAWRDALPSAQFAGFDSGGGIMLGPQLGASAVRVRSDFFETLGLSAARVGLSPEDLRVYQPVQPVALGNRFWLDRLGGDPSVVGRTFTGQRGARNRVVGILPPDFLIPAPGAEAVVPLTFPAPLPREVSQARILRIIVRLPAGMTRSDAADRLTAALRSLSADWPRAQPVPGVSDAARIYSGPFDRVTLVPVRQALTPSVYELSQVVFGAAVAFAFMACFNVGALAACRFESRRGDLAIRRSLGARPVHLLKVLAVENALLVFGGAAIGTAAAGPATAVTASLMPSAMSVLKSPSVDLRVLSFAVLTAVLTLAGITAACSRITTRSTFRLSPTAGERIGTQRARLWLLSCQAALGLGIVVAGGLVWTSLVRTWREPLGLDPDHAVVVRISTPASISAAQVDRFISELRRQPMVVAAGGIDRPFLQGMWNGNAFDDPKGISDTTTQSIAVTSGYFRATGLTAITGRLLTDEEIRTGQSQVVVSALAARQYWPGQAAVGRTVITNGRTFTVVGVVPDVRYVSLDTEPRGEIYWPIAAAPRPRLANLVIRLRTDAARVDQLITWMKSECRDCRISGAPRLSTAVDESIRPRRFNAWLFSAFAIGTVAIISVGTFGLVTMTASQRTRELGIRMALGATRQRLVRQVVREYAAAVGAGLIGGAVLASWWTKLLATYLYKTQPHDLGVWVAAVALVSVVTIAAAAGPAISATRIDAARTLNAK
jgi:putative ABC transport system permease protein